VTAALADDRHRGDGDAWLELCAEWDVVGEPLIDALLTPFPPVRPGLRVLARLRRAGGLSLVRKLLTPAADLGNGYFGGDAPACCWPATPGTATSRSTLPAPV
jgi:phytoene dehydrogenase-like protein